jgi:hypothetical protein
MPEQGGSAASHLERDMVKSAKQLGGSAVLRVLRGVPQPGVAEEARTRGFAAPALAGCAFVEVWRYSRAVYQERQAG